MEKRHLGAPQDHFQGLAATSRNLQFHCVEEEAKWNAWNQRRLSDQTSVAYRVRPKVGHHQLHRTLLADPCREYSHTACPHLTDKSPHEDERYDNESDAQDEEDYDAFDESETPGSSDDETDEVGGIVYSDFNLLRSDELDADLDMQDEGFSFDSFDNGQTLTGEDGAKAMALLLEIEGSSEASFAPGIARMDNGVISQLSGL